MARALPYLWIGLVLGCGTSEGGKVESGPGPVIENDPVFEEPREAVLPTLGIDADCEERVAPPIELCTWAQSADAVVWGTLSHVSVDDVPRARRLPDGKWAWDDDCERFNSGLLLRMNVTRTIWGSVPAQVDVLMGQYQVEYLSPYPISEDDAGVSWTPSSAQGLAPGMELGMPLQHYRLADGKEFWSLSGERMFASEAGLLYAQRATRSEECLVGKPALDGLTLSALADAVAGCGAEPSAEALAHRALVRRNEPDSTGPWSYLSSVCLDAPNPEPFVCDLDLRSAACEDCSEASVTLSPVDDTCRIAPPQSACVSLSADTPTLEPTLYYAPTLDRVFCFAGSQSPVGFLPCARLEDGPPACACESECQGVEP